jgi:flagellar motor protein MotB
MKLKKLNDQSFEEHESDELWAISYGDMITLLLSFFVIYFSTDFKKGKEAELDNHLISSFKMIDMKVDSKIPPTVINNGKDKIFEDAPKFDLLKNAKITKLEDRLIVTFEKMSFFKTGEIDPNAEGVEMLKAFAAKFTPYSGLYHISIKAFTDTRTVTNGRHRYKDNMELSALRALAALRIIQKAGVPLNKMEIAGYGEMNKLQSLIAKEKLITFTPEQIKDFSRTLILIIKHDNEQSVL